MLRKVDVNDLIMHIRSNKIAKVIEVSNMYGWFRAQFTDGTKKVYTLVEDGNQQFVAVTKEQIADYYFKMEQSGITDSWRE